MENAKDGHPDPESMLGAIGGEWLAGSGFETEQPDEGFGSEESAGKAGK